MVLLHNYYVYMQQVEPQWECVVKGVSQIPYNKDSLQTLLSAHDTLLHTNIAYHSLGQTSLRS